MIPLIMKKVISTKDIRHFQTVRNLIQRVHRWFGKEWTSLDWKQFIAEDTPKQSNSYDCGIFSLKFVDFVVSGKPFSFSQVDISRFRMEMASEIIAAMKLRSEDSEGFNGQMDQTVCTCKVLPEIKEPFLAAYQSESPLSCDGDVTSNLPAYPSESPVSCDEEVRSNLPADLSNQKYYSDEEVADSAAETDSQEFSYPARVSYPGLLNRVSTQESLADMCVNSRDMEGEAESTSSVETTHDLFGTFATWLQTADGGRKPEKMSRQHASQINKMLAVIDPKEDLASLFDRKLTRDTFLKNHAENAHKPDTIKSYLLSLRYFCSFVLTERPDAVRVNEASVHLIDEKARLWSSSYQKISQRRHLERQHEDLSNLITPEMVSEYEKSESARWAVALISQLSGAHCLQINQAEYTHTYIHTYTHTHTHTHTHIRTPGYL